MAGPKAAHVIAPGVFIAALGVVFVLAALRWLLPVVAPGSDGIGAVTGGGTLKELASALMLLIAGACLVLFAALRGRRLK